jgi:glycosyltransferase involved in cell wall biosynthesis
MIIFLAAKMEKGFGVSVVIDALCKEYAQMGIAVAVGCLESDGFFHSAEIVELQPDPKVIDAFVSKRGGRVIVAHTTPFFELLPLLADKYQVWSWEHGDPGPEFFVRDRQERRMIAKRKQREVYGRLNGVVAISEFVKKEIEFEQAHVIYNGCDHIQKRERRPVEASSLVRVGTLVRLGAGETIYKGRPILLQMYRELLNSEIPLELHIMGRGSETDKEYFEAIGIKVHLNASDEDRLEYLENLDIFVSTSLWEGFNLPLIEAQASGTVGIAFDVGAHPETTPIITRGVDGMVSLIKHYSRNPGLVQRHAAMCERWVRKRFNWAKTAQSSARLLGVRSRVKSSG